MKYANNAEKYLLTGIIFFSFMEWVYCILIIINYSLLDNVKKENKNNQLIKTKPYLHISLEVSVSRDQLWELMNMLSCYLKH